MLKVISESACTLREDLFVMEVEVPVSILDVEVFVILVKKTKRLAYPSEVSTFVMEVK